MPPLLFESEDVAVFVSGMQGQIVIMSSEEVVNITTGVKSLMPVYSLADLATLRDIWRTAVVLES
jgi:hypothetical protein